MLFFDERFQFDANHSYVKKVENITDFTSTGFLDARFSNAIEVPKNGYAYVFFTNESNTNVVIDNFTLSHERGRILEETHYYPGGMLQPNRQYRAVDYRYGFNGKEMDNDVKGIGAQYDYGFRIYDPRLVKFLSVDPLTGSYPWYTPYQFAGNSPITNIDLDGAEEYDYREECQNDGSVLVFITTGKHVLDQAYLQVSTGTGKPIGFFPRARVQEIMQKVKNFKEVANPGEREPQSFNADFPDNDYAYFPDVANPKSILQKGYWRNRNAIIFKIPANELELYHPKTADTKGTTDDQVEQEGNRQFYYNTGLTSGEVVFEYNNFEIPDKFVFKDEEGNVIKEVSFTSGASKEPLTFEFKNLKTPVITLEVISSDKIPENSIWNFKLIIQETTEQKEQREKQNIPCPPTTTPTTKQP